MADTLSRQEREEFPGRATRRTRCGFVLLAALLIVPSAAPRVAAQTPPSFGGFVLLIGGDTLATERYERTSTDLRGEIVGSGIGRLRYRARLAPDGRVQILSLDAWLVGVDLEGPPSQRASLRVDGDSAIAEVITAERTLTQRLASVSGAQPYLHPSFALVEQLAIHTEALGPGAVPHLFIAQGGETHRVTVERISADSIRFSLAGMEARLAFTADGTLWGGVVPARNLSIQRTPASDGDAPIPPEAPLPSAAPQHRP